MFPDALPSLPSPADRDPLAPREALPLPAPEWLLHILLVLTFVFHVLAMNVMLGGSLVAAFAEGWSRRTNNAALGRLGRNLAQTIPYAVAATITLGVAPLLFLQALYGRFFYTSSILMAVPWFSVIPLLVLAYYGFYRNAALAERGRPLSVGIGWGSALALLLVGFFYTHNMTLMLAPEKWRAAYSPYGLRLAGISLSMGLRYLHFVVASLAVTGAFVGVSSLWRRESEEKRWRVRFGGTLFVGMTLVQFVVGFGFLFSLEEPYRSAFLGGNSAATGLLMGGILFAVVAMGCFVWAMLSPKPAFPVVGGTGALFLTVVLMALVRDRLRLLALEPYLEPALESPQWGVMALFFLFFFAALAIVGWMLDAATKSARAQRVLSEQSLR